MDDDEIIDFGKFQGKPHSELLKIENRSYVNWFMTNPVLTSNHPFTFLYLKKKINIMNYDICSNEYIYLINLQNPDLEERKKIEYFENNISSYFCKLPTKW